MNKFLHGQTSGVGHNYFTLLMKMCCSCTFKKMGNIVWAF